MKMVLAVLLVTAACVDQPDVGDPTPAPTTKTGAIPQTHCGPAPQMPGWSYQVTTGANAAATVPAQQWYDHVAWAEEIQAWAACMSQ